MKAKQATNGRSLDEDLETNWVFSEDFPSFEDRVHAVNLFLPLATQKLRELLDKGARCGAWPAKIKLGGQKIWLFCRLNVEAGLLASVGFGLGQKPFVDQLFNDFENEQIAAGRWIYSTKQDEH